MKIPHWMKCQYTKWKTYNAECCKTHEDLGGVFIPLDMPLEWVELRERRNCNICGKTQDRKVQR